MPIPWEGPREKLPFHIRPQLSVTTPVCKPNPTIGNDHLSLFEAYLRKRKYSPNSIRNYCKAMQRFLTAIAPLSPADLSSEAVCKAMCGITASCDASKSYANHLINAVKCYYDAIEGRQLGDCILQRPSREATLPKVLHRDEVAHMLRLTTNLKHKCMLMLLYGAGLRSSELPALLLIANLDIPDIDFVAAIPIVFKCEAHSRLADERPTINVRQSARSCRLPNIPFVPPRIRPSLEL